MATDEMRMVEGSTVSTAATLQATIDACRQWDREDLAVRLRLAEARLTRPATLACIVGEYKRGKSALINALFEADVCPVDDDVATTSFAAVSADDNPFVRVHRTQDGRSEVLTVAPDAAWQYMSERGDPVLRDGVELVEVGVPASPIPHGFTLVDTPGVGGLLDQHAAAALRFLRLADAMLFVTDASQELTASEVVFLEQAHDVCPTVLVVVTKTDLYPAWRRIVELDRAHLQARNLPFDPVPASASSFREGRLRQLPTLETESGIPALREQLRREIVEGAKDRAAAHAASEACWALQRLREPIAAELAVLEDPDGAQEKIAELRTAEERLIALQTAGARWVTILNDGFGDLRADLDHRSRAGLRALLAELDERLEQGDPAVEWEDLSHWLQEQLAVYVDGVFAGIEAQATDIGGRVAALLRDDAPALGQGEPELVRVDELWGRADRALRTRRSSVLTSGLTALRGGSSGVMLLGVIARLGGFALATPASIGIAVLFGAKQVVDVRKQELARRRQEARTVTRQFVDEVSLEVGSRASRLVQERHRALRDGYTARLQELAQSARSAMGAAQAALAADAKARQERPAPLRGWLQHLDSLLAQLPVEEQT